MHFLRFLGLGCDIGTWVCLGYKRLARPRVFTLTPCMFDDSPDAPRIVLDPGENEKEAFEFLLDKTLLARFVARGHEKPTKEVWHAVAPIDRTREHRSGAEVYLRRDWMGNLHERQLFPQQPKPSGRRTNASKPMNAGLDSALGKMRGKVRGDNVVHTRPKPSTPDASESESSSSWSSGETSSGSSDGLDRALPGSSFHRPPKRRPRDAIPWGHSFQRVARRT